MNEVLFSLDIGTRTVVGVVSMHNGDKYEVVDVEIQEHPDRAMFDGQIHDIDKVCNVVKSVKASLEERTGYELKKVAIAAAGRALKTVKVSVERVLDGEIITKEIINNIEMEGIQKAQSTIDVKKSNGEAHYYCVGYNVSNYYIDGNMNINPKDHRGDSLSLDMIATFLPHIVVDSLYTVIDRAGLEVLNLTLEPIAAINIALPQNVRLLNIALVDVGAGTSDIAITKDGTVISFGMVAAAGDKFTEVLAQEYLLDFDQAEQLKISLNSSDEHTFMDIIGMTHTATTEEVVDKIKHKMAEISEMIGNQILEFNDKAPSAVFCIGGGCQIPGFTDALANYLQMDEKRVIIKPVESLSNVIFNKEPLKGPEFITPLGIGATALKDKENDFFNIKVNDKPIRLFNSKQLNVSDALVLVGYSARALLPERGDSLAYTINSKSRILKGGYGQAAKIFVNGKSASLDSKLSNRDSIFIEPGIIGANAEIKIFELISSSEFIFNDERVKNKYNIRVNDLDVLDDYNVQSGDEILFNQIFTVDDLLKYKGIDLSKVETYVNGDIVTTDRYVNSNDIIRTKIIDNKQVNFENDEIDLMSLEEVNESLITDDFTYEIVKPSDVKEVEETVNSYNYSVMVNGKMVDITRINRKMVFVDIFEFISFDISKPKGALSLKLNGVKANYTDYLKSGDIIEISWR